MSAAARQAAFGSEDATALSPQAGNVPETGWQVQAPQQGPQGQTGWQGQGPAMPQTGGWQDAVQHPTTSAHGVGPVTETVSQHRGRRAAPKQRRKGGVIAASVAAGAICVGLVTVAINGLAASGSVPDPDLMGGKRCPPSARRRRRRSRGTASRGPPLLR